MVIVDTSIIIDHLRQPKDQDSIFVKLSQKYPKQVFCLSILSIQELYVGKNSQDNNKLQLLLATIAPLKILPYTYEIAKMAGEIMRDSKQPIGFVDAAIAASAIINGCQLATLNIKDFNHTKSLEILSLN